MSGDGRREVALPDVTDLVLGDPWLKEAYERVKSDPARNPRVAILPFAIGPGTDPRTGWRGPAGGGAWRLRGIGQGILPPGGRPTPFHPPQGPDKMCAFMATEPRGLVYYVAIWNGDVALLIEVWEMRLDRPGAEASGRLRWRPGFTRPEVWTEGAAGLGTTRREALEREIWAFLEPQSPAGRRARGGPDPGFLGDLDRAVERVIVRNNGRDVRVGDWLTAMEMKKDTYYRRLRAWQLAPERVEAWVRHCVQDYWKRGAPGEGWELPVRLSDLAPRDFCD